MQFLYISPQHTDYQRLVSCLEVAFQHNDDPDKEYQSMKEQLSAGTLSLYHLIGDGVDLSIVGEVDGHSYYIWGVAGKGFKEGISELLKRIKLAGLKSVTCATAIPGIRRMYRYFGINRMTQTEWQKNGKLCTWHELEV